MGQHMVLKKYLYWVLLKTSKKWLNLSKKAILSLFCFSMG